MSADHGGQSTIELKYRWKRDRQVPYLERYFGWDGEWKIGMVQRHHMGHYEWFNQLSEQPSGPTLRPATGMAETPRLAAKACEECVDRQYAGDWPTMTESERVIGRQLATRNGRQENQPSPADSPVSGPRASD